MDKYIYYRISGGVILLSLTSFQLILSLLASRKLLPDHPELKIYDDLGPRYNTVWNTIFLYIYSIMSLICDITTLKMKEDVVPSYIREFRFRIFHEVLFPQVVGMSIFWPIFFYDRELVFPTEVDILITPFGNFVFHGLGIVYVVWEIMFVPRNIPDRSVVKIRYLLALNAIYACVVLYTRFIDLKVWMYGVLTAVEGTILLPMTFFGLMGLYVLVFHIQWRFKDFVWSLRENKDD